jgi:hypothetical protein
VGPGAWGLRGRERALVGLPRRATISFASFVPLASRKTSESGGGCFSWSSIFSCNQHLGPTMWMPAALLQFPAQTCRTFLRPVCLSDSP